MRPLALFASALFAGSALAVPWSPLKISRAVTVQNPTVARPGGIEDVIITKENSLNGTGHEHSTIVVKPGKTTRAAPLPLAFINNFSGGQVNAYIQGLDSANKVVFVRADGSLVYPSSGGSQIPVPIPVNVAIPLPGLGSTFRMNLPTSISSGRIYFCEGRLQFFVVSTPGGDGVVQPSVENLNDPSSGLNWGFVEFTYTPNGVVYANISYVDFVGMILSMALSVSDGSGTQTTRGLQSAAVNSLCTGLNQQTSRDGRPWNKMCVTNASGRLIRVLSPNTYHGIDANGFNGYWDGYVNQVWSKYTSAPLTINTQTPRGNTQCRVSGTTLNCNGDSRGYQKPTAVDIWGCNSGPFTVQASDNDIHRAVVPRLCAAFVRSTLLLAQGNVQPGVGASQYYLTSPTNHYSRIVHALEIDGRGYAFSYDDVNPDGAPDSSGLVSSGNPSLLTVHIGGSG